MDKFDSNLKNGFDHKSELPEGFGWDDIKEGIYEKMQTAKPEKNNQNWKWLILLLLIVCGSGTWFASKYSNEKKSIPNPILSIQKDKPVVSDNSKNVKTINNTDRPNNENISTADTPSQSDIKQQKVIGTKKRTHNTFNVNTPQNTIDNSIIESKKVSQNELNIPINYDNIDKYKTTKTTNKTSIIVAHNPSKISDNIDKLPSIVLGLIASHPSNLNPSKAPKTIEAIKTLAFKKHVSFGLAGGVLNWTAFDATNINHDFINGFPGYSINPSISLYLRPKHALQIDYEYGILQELFDYEGSRLVETAANQTVVEVRSSLTGNLLYSTQEDVTVYATRSYRELKYNQHKFHTLNLGYRFDQITMGKSSFGFYMGASYLLRINSKGKRLNEQLDVVSFDKNNPLFKENQLGLRLGIHYNYQLNSNIKIFSQLISTKYITNWELDDSNSSTRPLIYGVQIGLKYPL